MLEVGYVEEMTIRNPWVDKLDEEDGETGLWYRIKEDAPDGEKEAWEEFVRTFLMYG